jgi:FkbM family methyltransferase
VAEIFDIEMSDQSLKFEIHPELETFSNIVRYNKSYSQNDIFVMSQILKPGDIFIDAGANIGWHSLFGAKFVGPSGHVYAFEPEKKNFALLEKNLQHNQITNVSAFEMALGCESKEELLYLSEHNFGDHIVGLQLTELNPRSSVTVPCTSLDEFFEKQNIDVKNVRLIKMDVQGSEPDILLGLRKSLKTHRPAIILEFAPKHICAVGASYFDIFAFIDKYRYMPQLLRIEKDLPADEILKPLSVGDLFELSRALLNYDTDQGADLLLLPN